MSSSGPGTVPTTNASVLCNFPGCQNPLVLLSLLLEYDCFTMLCYLLPYNNMNQPYVYIYIFPLEPLFHPYSILPL